MCLETSDRIYCMNHSSEEWQEEKDITSNFSYFLCALWEFLQFSPTYPNTPDTKLQQTQQWPHPQILHPFSQVGFPVNLTWATSIAWYFLHFWSYSPQICACLFQQHYLSGIAFLPAAWPSCSCSTTRKCTFFPMKMNLVLLWCWYSHMVHINIVLSSQKMRKNRKDKNLHT